MRTVIRASSRVVLRTNTKSARHHPRTKSLPKRQDDAKTRRVQDQQDAVTASSGRQHTERIPCLRAEHKLRQQHYQGAYRTSNAPVKCCKPGQHRGYQSEPSEEAVLCSAHTSQCYTLLLNNHLCLQLVAATRAAAACRQTLFRPILRRHSSSYAFSQTSRAHDG